MTQTQTIGIIQMPQPAIKVREYVEKYEEELRKKYGDACIAVVPEVGVIDYGEDRKRLHGRIERRTHLRGISPNTVCGTIDDILDPKFITLQLELTSSRGAG